MPLEDDYSKGRERIATGTYSRISTNKSGNSNQNLNNGTRFDVIAGRSPRTVVLPGTNKFSNQTSLRNTLRDNKSIEAQGEVTLNLVGVSIAQAAKAVLGDILKLNYVIDPRIKGKMTVQTSRPISVGELIDLFEASLKTNGAAIVQNGGIHRIVPVTEIVTAQAPLRIGRTVKGIGLGKITQIVPLNYVSAAEMNRVLEPISPKGAILRIDENRNSIVLSGTRGELSSMLETISVFDVDWLKGMSFALIPVKSVDPEAIANELETVFKTNRKGPLEGIVRFVPNRRLRSVLVISSRSSYLRRATAWVKRLDAAAQGSEKQLFVYDIQNREAGELANLIRKVFVDEVNAKVDIVSSVAPNLTPATISGQIDGPDSGRTDFSNTSTTGNAPGSQEARIKIVADEANNSLLILSTPLEYRRVLRVIQKLDVVAKQVLIEATIAEVTLNDDLRFGVKWFFENGNSGITLADTATGIVSPIFPGFSYFFSAPKIRVALDALQKITDLNIISSPSLMVLNNKTARLQIGDQVPIATRSAVDVANNNAPIVNNVELRDTGVILSVTPRVNKSGQVTLEIEQEVSSVVPTTTSAIDSPTIQQRKIKTTVVVSSGASLVLGGLTRELASNASDQVPLFGDIPILGNLFKQKSNVIEKTELLIIITPHVVRNRNEARLVTNEFRKQLNLRIPRIKGKPKLKQNIRRILQ